MTLDDFLRAFEALVEDREASDDDPGEGNYGCEDCRACNHCRFCIGCDSCEDCTYCDECLDCTSCTQSKRCVSCKKVSYCEDSRECKESRYLTLCVNCTDCVHCLACVGIEGGEFFVLNQKRTRKEYFALLRQTQELMLARMDGGWRPPNIGLASEVFDQTAADRNDELSAAPWLTELVPSELLAPSPALDTYDDIQESEVTVERPSTRNDHGFSRRPPPQLPDRRPPEAPRYERGPGPERDPGPDSDVPERRGGFGQTRPDHSVAPSRPPARPSAEAHEQPPRSSARTRARPPARPPERRHERGQGPGEDSSHDWVREPPAFGTSYSEGRDELSGPSARARDYGHDLGHEFDPDDDWERGPGSNPENYPRRHEGSYERDPGSGRARGSNPADREESYAGRAAPGSDVPTGHRQEQATQPFRREPRVQPSSGAPDDIPVPHLDEGAPAPRGHEPSSPWLDEQQTQAHPANKRGSLRRAGRPKRPDPGSSANVREGTGSESFRAGSEGTHTGLRLGRKPKKRR